MVWGLIIYLARSLIIYKENEIISLFSNVINVFFFLRGGVPPIITEQETF